MLEDWVAAASGFESGFQQIGDVGHIVESKFWKKKYGKGERLDNGTWVFGGVDRQTGECFMDPLEKRDKETLLQLILKWVKPGTTIYSDGWAAYINLR